MQHPVLTQVSGAVKRSIVELWPHQSDLEEKIYQGWNLGGDNVLAVLPTAGGKTVIVAKVIHDHAGPVCAIAHRRELVAQISLALARNAVRHRIIGPANVVRQIVNLHMLELGVCWVDPSAKCAVASVDTLIRRKKELKAWSNSVTLWFQDEAHHVLVENKWGEAAQMFPNAKGLGVTATPDRADGKGLGRHADGLFDTMVVGPGMRDLINAGYLTDYIIFAPPSHMHLTGDDVSKNTGDYKLARVVEEFQKHKGKVIGDIVSHYLKHARGKLGITFVPDVADAVETAAGFNAAGVPAAVVTAKTPDAERISILRRFRNRDLLQLVNVDLFGEGFDLPAIEVVSMARKTASYSLYVQQFGRALRLMIEAGILSSWAGFTDAERLALIAASIKPTAIIIDHVGNVEHHRGPPDVPRVWSLDRREKRRNGAANDDVIPVRSCAKCTRIYERIYASCPHCGHTPKPPERSSPQHVDGDLLQLDPAVLAAMRGEIAEVDKSPAIYQAELAAQNVPGIGQRGHVTRHAKRQKAQAQLRANIAWWAGWQRSQNRPDSESYRRFYFKFGIDVMSAQALNSQDALELNERINKHIGELVA